MTVTLKAARAGVITGVLLAFARIAGETAPLLFTALSNQFWTSDLTEPMANLPVTIFKFAMSPYENWQKLAWAGVFLITLGVLVLNILARVFFRNKTLNRHGARHGRQGRTRRSTEKAEARGAQPQLLLRQLPRAEEHQPRHPREQGHRVHRPVGLRQVDAAAHLQPHVRALSRAARRRRDPARRREHPDLEGRRLADPRQGRHGVPEADAVPDVDLRQHRLRREAVRDACRASRWTSASSGR